jgi:hypothetical protein
VCVCVPVAAINSRSKGGAERRKWHGAKSEGRKEGESTAFILINFAAQQNHFLFLPAAVDLCHCARMSGGGEDITIKTSTPLSFGCAPLCFFFLYLSCQLNALVDTAGQQVSQRLQFVFLLGFFWRKKICTGTTVSLRTKLIHKRKQP